MLKWPMQKKFSSKILIFSWILTSVLMIQTAEARTFFGRTIQLPVQKIAPGTGQISINLLLPENHQFVKEAPSTIFIRTKHAELLKAPHARPEPLDLFKLPYTFDYSAQPGQTVAVIDIKAHFCDKVSKICLVDFIRVKFPIQIEADAPSDFQLRIPLKSKTAS